MSNMTGIATRWIPSDTLLERLNRLIQEYRGVVTEVLQPLVEEYYPGLLTGDDTEYRKMIELSTKMTLVGHACTAIAGKEFDARKKTISALYGGCCFLADSFIDDFGEEQTREYLRRFEEFLGSGWFASANDRERLFYVIAGRMFHRRDIMDPTLRQAVMLLYLAQKRDCELRTEPVELQSRTRRQRLRILEESARNRGGHTIMTLATFLVTDIPLTLWQAVFRGGMLFMHIDDHGDCYSDLRYKRLTYMNQVRNPERALRDRFFSAAERMYRDLPPGEGKDILLGFLYRYYVTRIAKHRIQREAAHESWAVYE